VFPLPDDGRLVNIFIGTISSRILEIKMIEISLISNSGCGMAKMISVVAGTTLANFLEVHFDGNPDDFKIRVRSNGMSVEVHDDYVLQDGDRVSLTPAKVDGAS